MQLPNIIIHLLKFAKYLNQVTMNLPKVTLYLL